MEEDAFFFTMDSLEAQDYLLSFLETLLEKREDARLENFVEPDVKITVYTWKGKLPWLKHKYGNSINVGQGMEPYELGI